MNQKEISNRLEAEKEALQNCETEPIQYVAYIQPFGCLLAVDTETDVIIYVSENLQDWVSMPIDQVLGAKMDHVFSRDMVHQFNNALAHSTISSQREYVGRITDIKTSDVFIHEKARRLIIELQPTSAVHKPTLKIMDVMSRINSRLKTAKNIQQLLNQMVIEFRALSGFNRVKAYRFLNDGSGEIVAESREPQLDSFLGLRFPAIDIPQSARKIYERNPIRIIPSVTAEQVRLLSIDKQKEPLDLSLALFRGHVPVHMLYLQNMGIQATLSLHIILNGKMWGFFAFHHMSERMLDSETISALQMLNGSVATVLELYIREQGIERMEECARVASTLFLGDDSPLGFSANWKTASSELATLIDCDGVGLLSYDRYDTYGTCPTEGFIQELASFLDDLVERDDFDGKPFGIDSNELSFSKSYIEDAEGILVIPKPAVSYRYLFYFRKDIDRVIRWAGNPSKDLYKSEDGFRLNPRTSFAEYQEQKAFDHEELMIAHSLQNALSMTMSSIIISSHHRERLGLVVRELNHRVRNMLALIGSIITQSQSSVSNVEDFVETLKLRLDALSETQKLLTEYDWKEVDIQVLVESALIPYHVYLGTRLVLQGDQFLLPASLASLLALILNELASNAVKYGALSNSDGIIYLQWHYDDTKLNLSWTEKYGPSVEKPTRHGFGTTLIKEALAYEFGADCTLDFMESGIDANFAIPVKHMKGEMQQRDLVLINEESNKQYSFVALVLEDDFIIAKEMTSHLNDLGATRVDSVATIEGAIALITEMDYDVAFLDANIKGEYSIEVANVLEKVDVPFVFTTGFGSKDQELNETACVEVLSKPVSKLKLSSMLKLVNLVVSNE